MYSPRSDEWERLPWLADIPVRVRGRSRPVFPVRSVGVLMAVVAAGSFWAGSTSIRAEHQQAMTVPASATQLHGVGALDDTALLAAHLSRGTSFSSRRERADAPY